ncbi:MAG: hypothetical protein QOJ56_3502 [Mycobacterium sp.]|nr:hypothetical protein [Mycobacterium sp.]
MPAWTAKIAAALRSFQSAASRTFRRKVKSTAFPKKDGGVPYNASGVVQVGPRRFVFVDNRDPSALFEFTLDADGAQVGPIEPRPLVGIGQGHLGDPEGLTRVDLNGETFLVAASSLCTIGGKVNDGLVRVRYTPDGDLHAEAMDGFRSWLLSQDRALDEAGALEPDRGGLNIEGIAWDPGTNALLLGQRGPAEAGRISMIHVPVDVGATAWTTAALSGPTVLLARIPQSPGTQGIRDISYDDQTGDFLILLGRSLSGDDAPFQLCAWTRGSDDVRLIDVKFEKNMKPEGVTTFSIGGKRKILVVDDAGGYAVFKVRHSDQ